MRSYTVAQVRAAEAPLIEAGVPLMRRAATALAARVREAGRTPVVVLAGPGDNGGDALYAAAELAADAEVLLVRTGTAVHEAAWAAATGAGAREIPADAVGSVITDDAVIVDGMRGIGGSGAGLRDLARETALRIRPLLEPRARPLIVAVDVPSGIDADTGAADDAVLPADVTVTFGALKRGLTREPARGLGGRIEVADIGLGLRG
ncbi:MAG TPA: NAD(P)H-hydrate epimerase [Pseudolysinimonas sp.]|nr:NAD(P)H-hydrate epimerase [Pseudolysinimonas sp.]